MVRLTRTLASILTIAAILGCRQSEGSYQGYANRTAAIGDSALVTVTTYVTLDSTSTVRYDSSAARNLERLTTRFGGIMRPDTVAVFHRQMLEGLADHAASDAQLATHARHRDGLPHDRVVPHATASRSGPADHVSRRLFVEGLDSLVLAMRVLHDREVSCTAERTIDCVDTRDFSYILGSIHSGVRIYLDARRRMRETLRALGATFPDPPPVSPSALTSRAATRPAP